MTFEVDLKHVGAKLTKMIIYIRDLYKSVALIVRLYGICIYMRATTRK